MERNEYLKLCEKDCILIRFNNETGVSDIILPFYKQAVRSCHYVDTYNDTMRGGQMLAQPGQADLSLSRFYFMLNLSE